MADSMIDSARTAASAVILAKRDELLRERAMLQERRAELLALTRRNERALADCRAAARLFQVEAEFPPDDDEAERELRRRVMRDAEERERLMVRERSMATMRAEAELRRSREAHNRAQGEFDLARNARFALPTPPSRADEPPPPPPQMPAVKEPTKRPSLRVFLLEMLKNAGPAGAKAAPLREQFEKAYGEIIHEKTVGMTLYRLSKEGLVSRDGHNWFFVSQLPADETANPGGGTPGPDNRSN